MTLELFTTTADELVQKPIDIYKAVYDCFNDTSYYSDDPNRQHLYDEYVKYTQDYSTNNCMFKEQFEQRLPKIDKMMQYFTVNYDSIKLEQEDKYVTIYIDIIINVDLFKNL